MKRLLHTAFLFMASASAFAQFPAPYCTPTPVQGIEPITQVTFAGIDNSSSAVPASDAHEDFTAFSGNVTANQSYSITLKGNTVGEYINPFIVFVDWNMDNDFEDQGETYHLGSISNSTGEDGIELNANILVPGTALEGTTRMRVTKYWDLDVEPNSCNDDSTVYGQVEDYSLVVTGIPQCLSGTNFPVETITTGLCNGGQSIISTQSQPGQYFVVSVTSGEAYTFRSSVATDLFTVSTDDGLSAEFSGTSPFQWIATVSGTVRVYLNTDYACGTEAVDRTTTIGCGFECLNGSLFPILTYSPAVCDSVTLNLITDAAFAGQYANVNVQMGSTYVFSSSVASDYFTLSQNGVSSLVAGESGLVWQATLTGPVRVYLHTDAYCGTETGERSTYVSCQLLEVPGCVSNLVPTNEDTLYVSEGPYDMSWDLPATGGYIESYTIYISTSPSISDVVFTDEFPFGALYGINLEPSDINQTYYWWIVPTNAAGPATCTPVINSFVVLDEPSSVNAIENAAFEAFPNPVNDVLYLQNIRTTGSLQVINALGQTLQMRSINTTQERIDMTAYPTGMYLLKLTSTEGLQSTVAVIKK